MTDEKPKIWQLQAQFDIDGLVKALRNDNPVMRKRAAAALRVMGAVDAVPALRAALADEMDAETRTVLAAALQALGSDGSDVPLTPAQADARQQLVQNLIDKLEDRDIEVVVAAAQQLGDLNDKLAVEPLVMLFKNPRVAIRSRLAAAEALLKLEGAPVEATLLRALRHDDWNRRRTAAAILGKLRADWAIEPLSRALNDPQPSVRRTARAALKFIGTPDARRALANHNRQRARRTTLETPAVSEEGEDETGLQRVKHDTTPLLKRLREAREAKAADEANADASQNPSDEATAADVASSPHTQHRPDPAQTQPMAARAQADTTPLHQKNTEPLSPEMIEQVQRLRQGQISQTGANAAGTPASDGANQSADAPHGQAHDAPAQPSDADAPASTGAGDPHTDESH